MLARDAASALTEAAARPAGVRAAAKAGASPLLQRAIVVQRDVVDDADFAVAARDPARRRDAITYLDARPGAPTDALDLATVETLLPLVGPTQHAARGALAERGLAITTKQAPQWEKAANFILILDDPGIDRNLARLTDVEVKLLGRGARLGGRATDERLMTRVRNRIRRGPGQLFGAVTVEVSAVHDGTYNRWGANASFEARADITFTPDPDLCDATVIAFVQTVSMLRNAGADSVDNRPGVDDRFNSKKQAVDRPERMRSGYFGEANDQTFAPSSAGGVTTGVSHAGTVVPAVLLDKPTGKTEDVTYNYETAITAKEGPDAGMVYAVVLWSFLVDGNMKIHPNPWVIRQTPTGDFGSAVAAWNRQAATQSGSRGQQPLPAQRLAIGSAGSSLLAPRAGPHRLDATSRGRVARTLQRAAGNHAVGRLIDPASPCRPVQRQVDASSASDHVEALAKIQGGPMYDLLPRLAALDVALRSDEDAARRAGGPRLVVAERAVRSKGDWQAFALANAAEIADLPLDQIADLMRFVGAPTTVRVFDRSNFDGRFDGMVDPTTGTITLIMRVKFLPVEGQTYSGDPVGTKAWEQSNVAAFAAFGPKFKAAVESAWSVSGPVKPACSSARTAPFATRVSVQVVESNEHLAVTLYGVTARVDSSVDQQIDKGQTSRKGRMQIGDTELRPKSHQLPSGSQLTSAQVTAAHEFGHAMGLHHVGCDGNSGVCYGTTQSQYDDLMGGGMAVGTQTIGTAGGARRHDDLESFEKIGERWGRDIWPGLLGAGCNTWGPAG